MTIDLFKIGAITLFVTDVERSRNWYAKIFDRSAGFEDADSAVLDFDHHGPFAQQLRNVLAALSPREC